MTNSHTATDQGPTVRDLLERYEENKEDMEAPHAMIAACDEILEEMDGDSR